jgi:hypothetical protein
MIGPLEESESIMNEELIGIININTYPISTIPVLTPSRFLSLKERTHQRNFQGYLPFSNSFNLLFKC